MWLKSDDALTHRKCISHGQDDLTYMGNTSSNR